MRISLNLELYFDTDDPDHDLEKVVENVAYVVKLAENEGLLTADTEAQYLGNTLKLGPES